MHSRIFILKWENVSGLMIMFMLKLILKYLESVKHIVLLYIFRYFISVKIIAKSFFHYPSVYVELNINDFVDF